MRQKTKKHRNQRLLDKKFRFCSQSRRHMPRWVPLVQKTRAKNSHAWAPLRAQKTWSPVLRDVRRVVTLRVTAYLAICQMPPP
jgi:hypothetical protein